MNYRLEYLEEDGTINLYVPLDKSPKEALKFLETLRKKEVNVVIDEGLSEDQRKKIWALCKAYGDEIGYSKEEMREILENSFCEKYDIDYFSLSVKKKDTCTLKLASKFIQYIIEHSIYWGFNLIIYEGKGKDKVAKFARDIVPEIGRYIVACLRAKRCAICGSYEDVTIHHWDTVASTVGTYKRDDGLHGRMISLCGKCHSIVHNMPTTEVEEKYHVYGVLLGPKLVEKLKKIYPSHFQAFKKEEINSEKRGA